MYTRGELFSDLMLIPEAISCLSSDIAGATRLRNPRLESYGYIAFSALYRRNGSAEAAQEWLDKVGDISSPSSTRIDKSIQQAAIGLKSEPEISRTRFLNILERENLRAISRTLANYFIAKQLSLQKISSWPMK